MKDVDVITRRENMQRKDRGLLELSHIILTLAVGLLSGWNDRAKYRGAKRPPATIKIKYSDSLNPLIFLFFNPYDNTAS
jgi:hypothetical protein